MSSTNVIAKEVERFDISKEDEADRMLEYLNKHGYAVVAGAANEMAIQNGKDQFWTFWEDTKYKGPLDRNDPKTWNNWMANTATGILVTSRGANHCDFLWDARVQPLVRKTFAKVWGSEELITSFDAGGVFRPWKHNIQWLTNGGWWHVDQNSCRGPSRQGRITVQGLVTYYDATPETGGLCVIPGSHLHHDEVCQRSPSSKNKIDFVSIQDTDPILQNEGIMICCKAGDLVLWDSRTVHCNSPALHMASYYQDLLNGTGKPFVPEPTASSTTVSAQEAGAGTSVNSENDNAAVASASESEVQKVDLLRLVAYVCMVPRSHATSEVLQNRKEVFCDKIGTGHLPTFDSWYKQKEKTRPWTTRRDILELVGYTEAEIERIQNGEDPDNGAWCTIS